MIKSIINTINTYKPTPEVRYLVCRDIANIILGSNEIVRYLFERGFYTCTNQISYSMYLQKLAIDIQEILMDHNIGVKKLSLLEAKKLERDIIVCIDQFCIKEFNVNLGESK